MANVATSNRSNCALGKVVVSWFLGGPLAPDIGSMSIRPYSQYSAACVQDRQTLGVASCLLHVLIRPPPWCNQSYVQFLAATLGLGWLHLNKPLTGLDWCLLACWPGLSPSVCLPVTSSLGIFFFGVEPSLPIHALTPRKAPYRFGSFAFSLLALSSQTTPNSTEWLLVKAVLQLKLAPLVSYIRRHSVRNMVSSIVHFCQVGPSVWLSVWFVRGSPQDLTCFFSSSPVRYPHHLKGKAPGLTQNRPGRHSRSCCG